MPHRARIRLDGVPLHIDQRGHNRQAVNRNSSRFPSDFMWTLTTDEWRTLRSQFAILKAGLGQHRKYLPTVFTEHGPIMAATLLNSPRAVQMSVYVVRAFVQQRELLSSNHELARQLHALEERTEKKRSSHDRAIAGLIETLRRLMTPPDPPKRPIGFITPTETDTNGKNLAR